MHRPIKPLAARALLALLPLTAPALALALPEDAQQPIQITADNALFDEKTGEALYRGNVQIVQGTLRVNGDTLTLRVDARGNLQTARTIGKQAHYEQKTDPAKGLVKADANEILFDNNTGVITLSGNAVLRQDSATFSGPRIVYSTLRKQIEASGNSTQRVQLTFPPSARTGGKTPASNNGSIKP
ncbi:MAG: lipopolysaccharide transport periplasmic protein LptA [Pseudomonadota bacterium]